MASSNKRVPPAQRTGGGGPAIPLNPELQLRRSIASCLLWESNFYEDGVAIAERIAAEAGRVSSKFLIDLAVQVRQEGLRHAPLMLILELIRRRDPNVPNVMAMVCRRPDDLTELVSLYWRDGRRPLAKVLRRGIQEAMRNFDAYQLAKYDRDTPIKIRDLLRLARPRPESEDQAVLWGRAVRRELPAPDTWETALSAGADRGETFSRLIEEGRLGYLALLRNIRLMDQSGVSSNLIIKAIGERRGAWGILPFQFLAAMQNAPGLYVRALEDAMLETARGLPKLSGKTVIMVDVSGSMECPLSSRSRMTRLDAAASMAAALVEMSEEARVYATATRTHRVRPARGMDLVTSIKDSMNRLGGGGIFLKKSMQHLKKEEISADRVIVITDEQECGSDPQGAPLFADRHYMMNVASHRNGIVNPERGWRSVAGFSEGLPRYIVEIERQESQR